LAQARDDQEGADFLMVKPGMMYLDIIRDVRNAVGLALLCFLKTF
jgi:porphobilinogen synthase